ncbi:hypothetical protein ACFVAV_11340 [Nocardia sp. NPDC057663]|uniref:hypothetical protein n=1 Tax=Nocardia sp. NPDC057663 TaxID=3346201 RepID=UPI00366FBD08
MAGSGYLHRRQDDYDGVRARADAFFEVDRRFPEDVFKQGCSRTMFMEFETGLSRYAWPALSALARMHGDDIIDVVTIDPGPGSLNFPAHWDLYPSFSLSVDATSDDYAAATNELCPEGRASMIHQLSDVVVITGVAALGVLGRTRARAHGHRRT